MATNHIYMPIKYKPKTVNDSGICDVLVMLDCSSKEEVSWYFWEKEKVLLSYIELIEE